MLSLFTSGNVGEYISRSGSRPLSINPQDVQGSQSLPLVVLIGEDTVSYGEVFAGVLQDRGRARLVGEPTAGNVETLHGYSFDDGSRLWIAQERFVPEDLAGRLGRRRCTTGCRGRGALVNFPSRTTRSSPPRWNCWAQR